ncbi:MAG: DUF4199 domain-containing protein [Bacteroidetes bacterium]|nr:DUF4199 domain-containing protein [Bacteroidota bacterium]MCY4205458.1 DUF4199 domain-containing protein [Bacteroidota bacterium]
MPSKIQSILVGGLLSAVTGVIVAVAQQMSGASDPLNPQPVLGVIFGLLGCMVALSSGLVAVWHYTSENELTISGGQGVGIGVLAGIVYAVAAIALSWLLVAVGLLPSPEETLDMVRQSGAFDTPGAEQAEAITKIMVTWGYLVITAISGIVMGLIGGAIGAAVFKRGSEEEMELSE